MSELPEALQKVIHDDDAWKAQKQFMAIARGLKEEGITVRDIARAMTDVSLKLVEEAWYKKGGTTRGRRLLDDLAYMYFSKSKELEDIEEALLRSIDTGGEVSRLSS